MSQPTIYNQLNDAASRRYTGYPLNSTLVSSYSPDTIRSIITHAAAGQPYSTAVWIRISRVGIQISAQDPQIARTRIPVFIPIGLVHDIFMLPSINNVICIVYDEVQSNMKGVLLYVIQPNDAQLIRDDFRIVKQANNLQQQQQPAYSNVNEVYPTENNRIYTPTVSRRSPLTNVDYRNTQTIRQPSPRRILPSETNVNTAIPPALPSKGSYHNERRRHRSPRRHRTAHSPTKRSSDSGIKQRKNKSGSPDRQLKTKLPSSRSSPDLTEQQRQQQVLMQQQMATWPATQQMPLIPMGMYNRYVPKTIPLPTGETLRTTLPSSDMGGVVMNGTAAAYIEPANSRNVRKTSRSPSPLPNSQSVQHRNHHHRRHHTNDQSYNNTPQPVRSRSKNRSATLDTDDETKQYIKLLVNEMQAMKMEMSKLQQIPVGTPRGRSDSIQIDLKEIRSHIDLIRARMAMTPRVAEKKE